MCNLYSITRNQAAIRDLFKVTKDTTGNLPPFSAIFPDQVAPVVRVNDGERELTMMRWGMPNPPQFPGITTNIRNTGSPHWRRWLAPQSRCLVPMSSFCEYADTKPKKTPKWFAIDETRPLVAFAGTEWNGVRGTKPGRGPPSALRLPDDRAQRRRRADPSEGNAGDPDHRGGMRRLDARAVG
jgi:putative SOS response-associated peptidase YedK